MAVALNMKEVLQRKSDNKTEDRFGKDGTSILGQNRLDCSPHKVVIYK
jgi:hypothetical protein